LANGDIDPPGLGGNEADEDDDNLFNWNI
jgi:hypothetical protein